MSDTVPAEEAPASGMPATDVVVVSYNSGAHLADCLGSIVGDRSVASVVVVDNGSSDDSSSVVARFPSVRWLPTGVNLGFGRAANRGIAATAAPVVVVLNPDTVVHAGAIGALTAALAADPRLGVVGPTVRNPDGTTYPSARAFPSLVDAMGHAFVGLVRPDNRWTRRYRNPDRVDGRVDWVSGTAMALRRSAVEQVGGFDEDYFMYVEDVDLCWRLRRAGWHAAVVPSAEVLHHIGASSEGAPYRMIAAHHRSLLRFEARTARGPRRLLLPVVALGLVVRTVAALAQRALRGRPHAAP